MRVASSAEMATIDRSSQAEYRIPAEPGQEAVVREWDVPALGWHATHTYTGTVAFDTDGEHSAYVFADWQCQVTERNDGDRDRFAADSIVEDLERLPDGARRYLGRSWFGPPQRLWQPA